MNFDFDGAEIVVLPSFTDASPTMGGKADLYRKRGGLREQMKDRQQRWREFLALLSPAALKYWASLLQLDRAAEYKMTIDPGWNQSTSVEGLKRQIGYITTQSNHLLDRENPIFFHFGIDAIGFTDEQRRLIMTLKLPQLMNTEAQIEPAPGAEDEPPYVVNEQGNLVRNTDYKSTGLTPKMPTASTTPLETAVEYLPFVAVGLGIFRAFFSG